MLGGILLQLLDRRRVLLRKTLYALLLDLTLRLGPLQALNASALGDVLKLGLLASLLPLLRLLLPLALHIGARPNGLLTGSSDLLHLLKTGLLLLLLLCGGLLPLSITLRLLLSVSLRTLLSASLDAADLPGLMQMLHRVWVRLDAERSESPLDAVLEPCLVLWVAGISDPCALRLPLSSALRVTDSVCDGLLALWVKVLEVFRTVDGLVTRLLLTSSESGAKALNKALRGFRSSLTTGASPRLRVSGVRDA